MIDNIQCRQRHDKFLDSWQRLDKSAQQNTFGSWTCSAETDRDSQSCICTTFSLVWCSVKLQHYVVNVHLLPVTPQNSKETWKRKKNQKMQFSVFWNWHSPQLIFSQAAFESRRNGSIKKFAKKIQFAKSFSTKEESMPSFIQSSNKTLVPGFAQRFFFTCKLLLLTLRSWRNSVYVCELKFWLTDWLTLYQSQEALEPTAYWYFPHLSPHLCLHRRTSPPSRSSRAS